MPDGSFPSSFSCFLRPQETEQIPSRHVVSQDGFRLYNLPHILHFVRMGFREVDDIFCLRYRAVRFRV